VTAYRTPADRIESVTRWRTPELDLHGYYLREVPGQVWTMAHLKELHLYNNRLTALPDSIGNLRSLTTLYLHDNQLTQVPDSLARLSLLTTLFLSGNRIRTLPAWLAVMPKLEVSSSTAIRSPTCRDRWPNASGSGSGRADQNGVPRAGGPHAEGSRCAVSAGLSAEYDKGTAREGPASPLQQTEPAGVRDGSRT
jgi:hypothetical protein